MKSPTTKKLFAFIITVMMFSVLTEFANAQTCNAQKKCPPGYTCINGRCKFIACNCFRRPIPFQCGQICGFAANKNETGNRSFLVSVVSNSVSKSTTISFSLNKPSKISAKIFDATGRLVKTFADQFFDEGEQSIEWNTAGVNEGVYALQLRSAPFSHMEKLIVAN